MCTVFHDPPSPWWAGRPWWMAPNFNTMKVKRNCQFFWFMVQSKKNFTYHFKAEHLSPSLINKSWANYNQRRRKFQCSSIQKIWQTWSIFVNLARKADPGIKLSISRDKFSRILNGSNVSGPKGNSAIMTLSKLLMIIFPCILGVVGLKIRSLVQYWVTLLNLS